MPSVLYISPMKLGSEVRVRQIHDRFPVEALERGAGVGRLAAFIGSGLDVLEVTVEEGDVQERFHRFLATPEVAGFFKELTAHVERLPLTAEGTAAMPLAAQMLLWQRGEGS